MEPVIGSLSPDSFHTTTRIFTNFVQFSETLFFFLRLGVPCGVFDRRRGFRNHALTIDTSTRPLLGGYGSDHLFSFCSFSFWESTKYKRRNEECTPAAIENDVNFGAESNVPVSLKKRDQRDRWLQHSPDS